MLSKVEMAANASLSKNNSQDRGDLVAYWSVPLYDGVHTVEFEHGTTTGKRVLRVDGQRTHSSGFRDGLASCRRFLTLTGTIFKTGAARRRAVLAESTEILRREWMFRLVGDEKFTMGSQKVNCELRVDPVPHFAFIYSLYVSGKPLEQFTEKQNRGLRTWAVLSNGKRYRVVFEKQTLDMWINGEKIEADNVFTKEGTEMRFMLDDTEAVVKGNSTDKKEGVLHQLYVNGNLVNDDLCV